MLQRTRADQVTQVYSQFIARYHNLEALSNARLRDLRKFTSHLGIHWRAKHFVESARYIIDKYKGRIPSERERLLAIPGVGEYVAGAILVAAYRKPEWIVDSNIARVMNRINDLNLSGEIRRKKTIVKKAKAFFEFDKPRELLFALLDFSALVCVSGKPLCPACLIRDRCKYRHKTRAKELLTRQWNGKGKISR